MYRIGVGQDSHQIKIGINPNKPFILGGYIIDERIEVVANSDGDIIIHSLCNALSSAIGEGSLDTFAGPLYEKGISDSKKYLEVVYKRIRIKNFKIQNISFAMEAGNPKLEKYRAKIVESLANILDIEEDNIGITFTSGNGLTEFSKGRGIQCFSFISLINEDANKSVR